VNGKGGLLWETGSKPSMIGVESGHTAYGFSDRKSLFGKVRDSILRSVPGGSPQELHVFRQWE